LVTPAGCSHKFAAPPNGRVWAGATLAVGVVSRAGARVSLDVDRDHAWAAVCPAAEDGLLAVHCTGPRLDSFVQPRMLPAANIAAAAIHRVLVMRAHRASHVPMRAHLVRGGPAMLARG
jgi:hypothetical protein